jgi:hypothetical protein
MEEATILFDKELRASVEDIMVGGGLSLETSNGR